MQVYNENASKNSSVEMPIPINYPNHPNHDLIVDPQRDQLASQNAREFKKVLSKPQFQDTKH